MAYLGSWIIDDYLTFSVNTHSLSTGGTVDADSAPSYTIYEDETATAIASGTMAKVLQISAAAVTGFYSERVQLTTAIGYEKGKTYTLRVEATIGGITVAKSDTFQIAQVTRETLDAVVESGTLSPTMAQAFRVLLAASAGKLSGAGTSSIAIRDINDTKDRIAATVSSGNRTAITLTLT